MQGGSSVPPGAKRSSSSLFNDTLKGKASKEWAEEAMSNIKEDLKEVKKIALSAKKSAESPVCLHENDIQSLSKAVNGWRNLKFGALLGFLVVVTGAIGQYFALADKAGDTEQSVETVKAAVNKIEGDVQEVTQAVEDHLDWEREEQQKAKDVKRDELRAISDVVKAAIEESNTARRRPR